MQPNSDELTHHAILLIAADYLRDSGLPAASAAMRAIVASGAVDAIAASECKTLAALHSIERQFLVGACLSAVRYAEGPHFEVTADTPRALRALVGAIVVECSLIDIDQMSRAASQTSALSHHVPQARPTAAH